MANIARAGLLVGMLGILAACATGSQLLFGDANAPDSFINPNYHGKLIGQLGSPGSASFGIKFKTGSSPAGWSLQSLKMPLWTQQACPAGGCSVAISLYNIDAQTGAPTMPVPGTTTQSFTGLTLPVSLSEPPIGIPAITLDLAPEWHLDGDTELLIAMESLTPGGHEARTYNMDTATLFDDPFGGWLSFGIVYKYGTSPWAFWPLKYKYSLAGVKVPLNCMQRNPQCAACSGTAPNDVCTSCVDPTLWTVSGGDCRPKTCTDRNPQCATCGGTAPNDVCTWCKAPALWIVDAGDCRRKDCKERDPGCSSCSTLDVCTGCTDPQKVVDKTTRLCRHKTCTERDPQCATCDAGVPPRDKCVSCKQSALYAVRARSGLCGPRDCRILDSRCATCDYNTGFCGACKEPNLYRVNPDSNYKCVLI